MIMMMNRKKRSSLCSSSPINEIHTSCCSSSPCSSSFSPACSPSTSSSSSSCVVDDQPQLPTTTLLSNKSPPPPAKTRKKRTAASKPVNQAEEQPKKKRRRGGRNSKSKVEEVDIKNSDVNNNGNGNSNRRSSVYRGVTRHRWTGRFEAHLWDKGSWNTIQNKKGKQVYLGAYDCEEDAARTYDLAALKYWGPDTTLNFSMENYTKEWEEMQGVSREEYLASLRRRSSGFSRGVSKYRGVARHHHNGRWEARIGRVFGNKYLYLGTFSSQEEAAMAYDLAAIEYRGPNAVTNFDISNYIDKAKNLTTTTLKEEEDQVDPPQPQPQTETPVNPPHIQQQLQEYELKQQQTTAASESSPSKQSSHHHHNYPQPIADDHCQLPSMIIEAATDCPDHHLNHDDHCDPGDLDPWSFCLDPDTGSCYNTLVLNDVPQAKMDFTEDDSNLLDLLDQVGFEDNIDFIFEELNNNNNNSPLLPSSVKDEDEEAAAAAYVAALLEEDDDEDNNQQQQQHIYLDDNNSTSSSPLSTVSSSSTSHLC